MIPFLEANKCRGRRGTDDYEASLTFWIQRQTRKVGQLRGHRNSPRFLVHLGGLDGSRRARISIAATKVSNSKRIAWTAKAYLSLRPDVSVTGDSIVLSRPAHLPFVGCVIGSL